MPFPKDWWKNWENAVNHGFKSFNSQNSMGLNLNCSWKLHYKFSQKRYGTVRYGTGQDGTVRDSIKPKT